MNLKIIYSRCPLTSTGDNVHPCLILTIGMLVHNININIVLRRVCYFLNPTTVVHVGIFEVNRFESRSVQSFGVGFFSIAKKGSAQLHLDH